MRVDQLVDNIRVARKANAVRELIPLAERFTGALQGERRWRAEANGESAFDDAVEVSSLDVLAWLAHLDLSLDDEHDLTESADDVADLGRVAGLMRVRYGNADEANVHLAARAANVRLVKDKHGIARLAYLAEIEVESQARRSAGCRAGRSPERACMRYGRRRGAPVRWPRSRH